MPSPHALDVGARPCVEPTAPSVPGRRRATPRGPSPPRLPPLDLRVSSRRRSPRDRPPLARRPLKVSPGRAPYVQPARGRQIHSRGDAPALCRPHALHRGHGAPRTAPPAPSRCRTLRERSRADRFPCRVLRSCGRTPGEVRRLRGRSGPSRPGASQTTGAVASRLEHSAGSCCERPAARRFPSLPIDVRRPSLHSSRSGGLGSRRRATFASDFRRGGDTRAVRETPRELSRSHAPPREPGTASAIGARPARACSQDDDESERVA